MSAPQRHNPSSYPSLAHAEGLVDRPEIGLQDVVFCDDVQRGELLDPAGMLEELIATRLGCSVAPEDEGGMRLRNFGASALQSVMRAYNARQHEAMTLLYSRVTATPGEIDETTTVRVDYISPLRTGKALIIYAEYFGARRTFKHRDPDVRLGRRIGGLTTRQDTKLIDDPFQLLPPNPSTGQPGRVSPESHVWGAVAKGRVTGNRF